MATDEAPAPAPAPARHERRDLRRAISRQAWLTQRARNALHRPVFIATVSVATFVMAIVSMVVVPRASSRESERFVASPRPDTLSLVGEVAMMRTRMLQADSAVRIARLDAEAEAARIEAEVARLRAQDTVNQIRRDSIAVELRALEILMARTEQAPLASSYRALAEATGLRSDVRVQRLADSLATLERRRAELGGPGGVDPVFVALTSQANAIGRTILAIAAQRRDALAAELGRLERPMTIAIPEPDIDTIPVIAARDSLRARLDSAQRELADVRALSVRIDQRDRETLARRNQVAPPLAMLAAALVLGVVIGFGVAFAGELRRPRVSTASELERFTGAKVLATVEPVLPNAERRRRQADRNAPPYLEPSAEGYQLAYLALATGHPAVLSAVVTGDDPLVSAIVASNIAAVAADEARNALLLDLDPESRAALVLRARSSPGLAELVRDDASWPDATVEAQVGRDRVVDLVPRGRGALDAGELARRLRGEIDRLGRYYDAMFILAEPGDVETGAVPGDALPAPDVIFCAQPGVTPLRPLRDQLERIRAAGGAIRGVVLWAAERPVIRAADARGTAAPAPSVDEPQPVA